jgi:Leucine-rich repeat (LRR) protein
VGLNANQLRSLPDNWFANARNLRELYFWRNPMLGSLAPNVDAGMAGLTALSRLNVHSCGLGTLPRSLTLLTDLTYLELGGNKLAEVDPNLFVQLTNLNSLWLYTNSLKVRACAVAHVRWCVCVCGGACAVWLTRGFRCCHRKSSTCRV